MRYLIPHHNYCLILIDRPQDQMRGRIIIPAVTASPRSATGVVEAVGPDVEGFKPGDEVLFPPYLGQMNDPENPAYEYEWEGRKYLFLLDQQILAKIKETPEDICFNCGAYCDSSRRNLDQSSVASQSDS